MQLCKCDLKYVVFYVNVHARILASISYLLIKVFAHAVYNMNSYDVYNIQFHISAKIGLYAMFGLVHLIGMRIIINFEAKGFIIVFNCTRFAMLSYTCNYVLTIILWFFSPSLFNSYFGDRFCHTMLYPLFAYGKIAKNVDFTYYSYTTHSK